MRTSRDQFMVSGENRDSNVRAGGYCTPMRKKYGTGFVAVVSS
jgi:hypothetical protein